MLLQQDLGVVKERTIGYLTVVCVVEGPIQYFSIKFYLVFFLIYSYFALSLPFALRNR